MALFRFWGKCFKMSFVLLIQDSAEGIFSWGKKWWKSFLYRQISTRLNNFQSKKPKECKWVKILEEKAGNSPCKTETVDHTADFCILHMKMGYYLPEEEVEGIVGPAPPSFPTSQDKINMCHNETLVLFIDIKLMDCKLHS